MEVKGIDAANFACRCSGTGWVVMIKAAVTQEAKCPGCDQWRHQDHKVEKVKTYEELYRKGWRLFE